MFSVSLKIHNLKVSILSLIFCFFLFVGVCAGEKSQSFILENEQNTEDSIKSIIHLLSSTGISQLYTKFDLKTPNFINFKSFAVYSEDCSLIIFPKDKITSNVVNHGYSKFTHFCEAELMEVDGKLYLMAVSSFDDKKAPDLYLFNTSTGLFDQVNLNFHPPFASDYFISTDKTGFYYFLYDRNIEHPGRFVGYYSDFNSGKWKKIFLDHQKVPHNFFTNLKQSNSFNYNGDRFSLFSSNNGALVFDKNSFKFYFKEDYTSESIYKYRYNLLKGSAKYVYLNDLMFSFHLSEMTKAAIDLGTFEFSPTSREERLIIRRQQFFISIGFVFVLLLVFYFKFVFDKKIVSTVFPFKKSKKASQTNQFEYLESLKTYQNLNVSADQLDEVLGITKFKNFESRKTKRAMIIKEINKMSMSMLGKEVILRDRDPNDKRFFVYKIKF